MTTPQTDRLSDLAVIERLGRLLDIRMVDLGALDRLYGGAVGIEFVSAAVRQKAEGRLQTLAINFPRIVVGACADRLEVVGFDTGDETTSSEFWNLFQDCAMDAGQYLATEASLLHGASYLLVWADASGRPTITPEVASEVAVERDPITRKVVRAVKRYRGDDGHGHLHLFSATEVQHYRTDSPQNDLVPVSYTAASSWQLVDVQTNPLGVVPIVPVVSRPSLVNPDGVSEVRDIIGVTKAVAKLWSDCLVTSEYTAMPRRWLIGEAVRLDDAGAPIDPLPPALHTAVIEAADAKTGSYESADLSNYTEAINVLVSHVGALTSTPPSALLQRAEQPMSAEALQASEAALVSKCRARQRTHGAAWAAAMVLAYEVSTGGPAPVALRRTRTVWRDAEYPSQSALADAAVKLAGILPFEAVAERLGYDPVSVQELRQQRRREALDGRGLDLTTLLPQQPVQQPPGALPGLSA